MIKTTNNFQNKHQSAQKPELPNFGMLIFGILIGVFATSLVVFMFSTTDITLKIPTGGSNPKLQVTANSITAGAPVQPQPDQPAAIQEPRFDFYSELAKNVPDSNPNPSHTNIANSDLKSTVKAIDTYIVQVGSFKRNADADALKAKLTLNGFNAKIEPMKLSDSEIRHKIILGPFKTEKHAQIIQQKLKTLEIDSIVRTL